MNLYEKTMAFILQHIDENALVPGDKLPTETAFATMTAASTVTIRRAMSELEKLGVVRKEQGRGTFLIRPRIGAKTTQVGGLRNSIHSQNEITTEILGVISRTLSEDEERHLGLSRGGLGWEITRLRYLGNKPAIREVAVVPKILAPDLPSELKSGHDSLYDILQTKFGLEELREEQVLVSRRPAPRECADLKINRDNWVIHIKGSSFDVAGKPFDYFSMTFVADLFEFYFDTDSTLSVKGRI